MRKWWTGAALVALGLAGPALAQMPGPPPGAGGPPPGAPGGHGGPMPMIPYNVAPPPGFGGGPPMSPPNFPNDPTPLPGSQFCPPGGEKQPDSPFSLPNDGSGNAFSCNEPAVLPASGCFVNVGWMALQRGNLSRQPLVFRDPGFFAPGIPVNVDSGINPIPAGNAPPVFGTGDTHPNWNNGVRASAIWREDYNAFELAGFYLFQTTRGDSVASAGQLDLPFNNFPTPIGFQGDNFLWLQADRVMTTLQTTVASGEANYRRLVAPGFEWLIGVRYLDIRERYSILTDDDGLTVSPLNRTLIATVSAVTHNRILAPQLGFEYEHPLLSWVTAGVTAKGAWGANFITIDNSLTRGDGREGPGAHEATTRFSHLYEVAAWGTVSITEQWRIKAGYTALWVVNVPEASKQINFNLGNPGGNHSSTGSIFWHGPMVEMQFAF
jgi:hypothetical protein